MPRAVVGLAELRGFGPIALATWGDLRRWRRRRC